MDHIARPETAECIYEEPTLQDAGVPAVKELV